MAHNELHPIPTEERPLATKQRNSGFTDKVRRNVQEMKGKAEKMMSSRNKTDRQKGGTRGKRA